MSGADPVTYCELATQLVQLAVGWVVTAVGFIAVDTWGEILAGIAGIVFGYTRPWRLLWTDRPGA